MECITVLERKFLVQNICQKTRKIVTKQIHLWVHRISIYPKPTIFPQPLLPIGRPTPHQEPCLWKCGQNYGEMSAGIGPSCWHSHPCPHQFRHCTNWSVQFLAIHPNLWSIIWWCLNIHGTLKNISIFYEGIFTIQLINCVPMPFLGP
jgi:hypothetical protein